MGVWGAQPASACACALMSASAYEGLEARDAYARCSCPQRVPHEGRDRLCGARGAAAAVGSDRGREQHAERALGGKLARCAAASSSA